LKKAKSENQTPLHIAYKKEHWKIFHLLTVNGAVFEPKFGKTLLYIATEINDYQLVKYLIEKGAEINARSDNQTPLRIAYKKEHFEIFHFLILKGTDLEAKNEKNQTVLQQATEARQYKIVNLLSYNNAHGKEQFSKEFYFDCSYTDLHFASEHGHFQNVEFLIEKGAEIDAKDKSEKTALHLASEKGYFEVVKSLVEKEADINAKDKNEKPALHFASEKGNLEIVKNLLQHGANIGAKDKTENTPLLSASENGHFDVYKFLAENGANLKDKNNALQGSLHLASCSDNVELVQYLIKKHHFDVNEHSEESGTPLMLATLENQKVIVKCLLEEGSDVNLASNLKLIKQESSFDFLDVFLNASPLHLASFHGHLEIVKLLVQYKANMNSICDLKIQERPHLFWSDKYENVSSLHLASFDGHLEIVKYLVQEGANVSAKCIVVIFLLEIFQPIIIFLKFMTHKFKCFL
jgi:ankyrin repeat protein